MFLAGCFSRPATGLQGQLTRTCTSTGDGSWERVNLLLSGGGDERRHFEHPSCLHPHFSLAPSRTRSSLNTACHLRAPPCTPTGAGRCLAGGGWQHAALRPGLPRHLRPAGHDGAGRGPCRALHDARVRGARPDGTLRRSRLCPGVPARGPEPRAVSSGAWCWADTVLLRALEPSERGGARTLPCPHPRPPESAERGHSSLLLSIVRTVGMNDEGIRE